VAPILIEETEDPTGLPDLLPMPDANASYCRLTPPDLLVEIRNIGTAPSGATTTSVDFFNYSLQNQVTPGILPGASASRVFSIPPACYDPDCEFRIIADSAGTQAESNEVNNFVLDACVG